MEINDCIALFINDQLAISMTNSATATTLNLAKTGFANFPSLDGAGYNTSFVTGFEIFDNGDEAKLEAAKAFIRFFYENETLMDYAQIGLPASRSTAQRVSEHVFMQDAYLANAVNTVDFTANNPNWRGVRNVFYRHIHDLLAKTTTPEAAAAAIDADCNAAIEAGWAASQAARIKVNDKYKISCFIVVRFY